MNSILASRDRRSLMGQTFASQEVHGDYRNGLLYKSSFEKVIFQQCKLDRASFAGSVFRDCGFNSCSLSLVNFNACQFYDCTFHDCELDQSDFNSSIIKDTTFLVGRAQYVSFLNAGLTNVTFDCDLHGADLRIASGTNVDFCDSNLWGASINISCSLFRDKQLSERQVKLLLSLIAETKGNDDLRYSIRDLAGDFYVRMMQILADRER